MYEELVERLRAESESPLMKQAADAIEELRKQRDLAFNRLCEWCGVCSKEHRNVWGCDDIAQLHL